MITFTTFIYIEQFLYLKFVLWNNKIQNFKRIRENQSRDHPFLLFPMPHGKLIITFNFFVYFQF